MSVSSQGSVLSFAVQSGGKVGEGNVFDPSGETWYKVAAPQMALGMIQEQEIFPLEMHGKLTPTGVFKQAVYFGGQVDTIPRVENVFGHLMKAALGTASTTTDTDADANAVVGVNTHIFRFDPADNSAQPWLAIRRLVPGITPFGEIGYDCKIGTMSIMVPAKGKVAARFNVLGRDCLIDNNPAAWTYDNDFEDSTGSADAGSGSLKFGGVTYPIVGLGLDIQSQLSTPDQEAVIGSFRPDDIIALTRNATMRFTYKWEDPDLYNLVYTGQSNGTEWTNLPFITNKDSSGYAFEGIFKAPAEIGATGVNYEMRIRASRVTIAVDGPIELQAGGIITQSYTATILEPAAGEDYLQVVFVNDATGY